MMNHWRTENANVFACLSAYIAFNVKPIHIGQKHFARNPSVTSSHDNSHSFSVRILHNRVDRPNTVGQLHSGVQNGRRHRSDRRRAHASVVPVRRPARKVHHAHHTRWKSRKQTKNAIDALLYTARTRWTAVTARRIVFREKSVQIEKEVKRCTITAEAPEE